MSQPEVHKRVKASELFRERAVARYFGAVRDLAIPAPDVDIFNCANTVPRPYIPQSSKDTALTAFAQLATLRLNASRSFVSLIDSTTQYILAEATKTLSIQAESRHGSGDSLWLGSVIMPRNSGFCGLALENAIRMPLIDSPNDDDIYVIEDLWEHPLCAGAPFLTTGPKIRFYAGAPLRSPDGTIVGIYCIFDDKLRPGGLTADEKEFLRDMSKTTVDHLEKTRSYSEQTRSNRLIGGLESFIDGLATVRSPEQEAQNRLAPVADNPNDLAGQDVAAGANEPQTSDYHDFAPAADDTDAPGIAPRTLWELALPPGSKPMFSRAANIIQQSGDYDGVAFFYMDSHHTPKGQSFQKQTRRRQSSTHKKVVILPAPAADPPLSVDAELSSNRRVIGSTDSEDSSAAEQPSPESTCPLLSYSLASGECNRSQTSPFHRFKQRDLDRLIGSKGPRARTITLNRRGEVLPGDTSSSGSGPEQAAPLSLREGAEGISPHSNAPDARHLKVQRQLIKSLRKVSSDALAYGCLPLWDFERQRYLAYCIVWSSSGSRHMKEDGDLTYLRIFGNSIAIALSHIDAVAANRAKSTFTSSLSHELRSPLHGVLSASNFLRDSALSRFQQEMVDVISKCGHTLLDTVDHVMDYAKISALAPENKATASPASIPAVQAQGEANDSSLSSTVDLSVLLEEVIETVLMGFSVQHDFVHDDEDPRASYKRAPSFNSTASTLAKSERSTNSRGRVAVAIQLPRRNWCVRTQTGAWRRIVMNLFGNALKYTKDGLITVRMDFSANEMSSKLPISLHIDDTGKGMSKQYLNTHLFTPFSQEDDFASGTGLGLSIVKQITDVLGGTIDISSSEGVGTKASVRLAVPTAPATSISLDDPNTIAAVAERLRGKRIAVLDDTCVEPSADATAGDTGFYNALVKTMKDWFGVDAPLSATWPSEPIDIVVCLKPMLKPFELASTEQITRQPIVIVTHDALEMAVLRADTRITREDAVIEMVSQPLGPHKLARCLDTCLQRQDDLNSDRANSRDDYSRRKSSCPLQIPIRRSSPTPSASPSEVSRRMSEVEHREPFVLIVDDNKVNLRLLSLFVKKQSLRYEEASNGQEALDIYLAAKDSVRCILMDVSMPVMDGMTATRKIREAEQQQQLPRTPIIALTGLTSAAARNEANEAGMDKFLIKPVSFDQLRDILSGVEGICHKK